jgi:hypothetical protein
MIRKYVKNPYRDLAVLKHLTDIGTWENPSRIRLGSGIPHQSDVGEILKNFLIRKYVESRPAENPYFKEAVKLAITPMIASLSILNYVDMNSEESVLGYGISLILLNVGMYVGVPAVVIIGIRKRF